jgi:hypothetical protein
MPCVAPLMPSSGSPVNQRRAPHSRTGKVRSPVGNRAALRLLAHTKLFGQPLGVRSHILAGCVGQVVNQLVAGKRSGRSPSSSVSE